MNVRRFIAHHKRALVVLSSLFVYGAVMFVGFILLAGVAISGAGEGIQPVVETIELTEIARRLNANIEQFSDATNFYSVSYSFWQSRDTYVRFSLQSARLDQFLTDVGLEVELQEDMNTFPSGMAAEALEWWNPEHAAVFSGGSHTLGLQASVYILVDQTNPACYLDRLSRHL